MDVEPWSYSDQENITRHELMAIVLCRLSCLEKLVKGIFTNWILSLWSRCLDYSCEASILQSFCKGRGPVSTMEIKLDLLKISLVLWFFSDAPIVLSNLGRIARQDSRNAAPCSHEQGRHYQQINRSQPFLLTCYGSYASSHSPVVIDGS